MANESIFLCQFPARGGEAWSLEAILCELVQEVRSPCAGVKLEFHLYIWSQFPVRGGEAVCYVSAYVVRLSVPRRRG